MPVFRLTQELAFPPPELAEEGGLLAVGGDLSPRRLLLAYRTGIFPWYSEGSPILWWSPDPRLVLYPEELRVSRSLRQTIRRGTYRVTMDAAFGDVIRKCSAVHTRHDGATWITPEMVEAYAALHEMGHAHSVESWFGEELAGGLYGLALGGAFFGESMFAERADASKVAFVALVGSLRRWGFGIVDCQVSTEHLKGFGAREVPREDFLSDLQIALKIKSPAGRRWEYSQ